MQNTNFWSGMLGLAAFAIVAAALLVLWKKGALTAGAMDALCALLNGVILPGDGPVGVLAYYAKLAVQAVEQLVKSGQLEKTDAARREKAVELVKEYTGTAGSGLSDAEINTVRSLVEAQVYELRQSGNAP